jgi:hypothetical protein
MSLPTYSFLPYLRQGLANNLEQTTEARAKFTVKLDVHGTDANGADKLSPVGDKAVEIYGPGDVVGIDPRSIIKTDPHNWITNFENNYLAHIDFYDEDFPWRYSPVVPVGQRLNPWLALVVLKEDEFTEGQSLLNRPLPYITVKDAGIRDNFFPKKEQLWAWAHVHVNGDITASDTTIVVNGQPQVNTALDKLQQLLDINPDLAYSRLLSPRKLRSSQSYHAFVIPAYESGRQAGIGASATAIANAKLKSAWDGPQLEFPYYYRWKFNTGTVGDFEYLVRMLKPKVADSRVGRRVMDMTNPGGNLIWQENLAHPLGGILRLGGALKVPEESLTDEEIQRMNKFDQWASKDFPVFHPFQVQVAGFLNLADDYNYKSTEDANTDAREDSAVAIDPNEDEDPIITPPVYGKWHAMVERVYQDRNNARIDNNYNWLNELNLDPRFRVPAHFGTRVVQQNQEDYMEAAWQQIGDVLKANTQIRYGQFSLAASYALYTKHLIQAQSADPSKALMFTAPLHKRVMSDANKLNPNNVTVFHHVKESVVPNVVLSAPMRRIVRPRGKLLTRYEKKLPAGQAAPRLETLITGISTGVLVASPPKTDPPALPTVDQVAGQLEPTGIPGFLKDWLRKYSWLPWLFLALAILIILLLFLFGAGGLLLAIGGVIAAGLIFLWWKSKSWQKSLAAADIIKPVNQTPQSVDTYPKSNDFRLSAVGETFRPTTGTPTDNVQATAFKNSLKDMYRLIQFTKKSIPPKKAPVQLSVPAVSASIILQVNPEITVPAWTWQQVLLPGWISEQLPAESFVEAMAYPRINKPMYEDLKKISDDLFLPNVELIEPNSITLLETNQAFIESYMVGLNHEFARELLWREYPTDQRGSYFRQFWDVSSILKDPALANKPEAEKREPYYDIPKLHEWRRASKLGSHDHRQKPGEPPREEVVLVIRGELLKKYPTAVVYAHKAEWTIDPNTGQINTNLVRSLHLSQEGDKDKPDTNVIKTPLYSAKLEPDIYFFGFDLTVEEARGQGSPQNPTLNNAGWFFVIKERAGEPRFGFDIPAADGDNSELVTWNDLDWTKVLPADEGVVDVLNLPAPVNLPATHTFPTDEEGQGDKEQYDDDKQVVWNSSIDSANLAYILYQVPMMVCVHSAEMLLDKD